MQIDGALLPLLFSDSRELVLSGEPRAIHSRNSHEAAHVIGIGLAYKTDITARAFSAYLTGELLAKNNFIGDIADVPAAYPGRVADGAEKLDRNLDRFCISRTA